MKETLVGERATSAKAPCPLTTYRRSITTPHPSTPHHVVREEAIL